jgi:cytochrome b pre-mRNA-processing protein 3
MMFSMFRPRPSAVTIRALYGAIVAQARNPSFYQAYGVPDTTTGRFEMIVLHQALVLRRLTQDGEEGRRLGQGLFDAFCQDMDDNLREMGVGDLAVPKKMRRMAEAFYGRAAAYDAALAGAEAVLGRAGAPDRAALAIVLARNIWGETATGTEPADRLACYVVEAVQHLAATSRESIAQAAHLFPDALAVAPA